MTSNSSNFWKSGAVPLIEPEFLGSIIGAASDIALVVSADGTILSVVLNTQDKNFGNLKHWESRPLSEFLTDECIDKFAKAHGAYLNGTLQRNSIELNHCDNAEWQYPVRYTFHRFGKEDAVLLLGRDLGPIAETQQQLVQAQIALEKGYDAKREFTTRFRVVMNSVSDAVVFVSATTGRIEDANEKAATLLGHNINALPGSSFESLLADYTRETLMDALMNATLSDESAPVLAKAGRSKQRLAIHPVVFRAAGQRSLMCKLFRQDSSAKALTATTNQAATFFRETPDAMAFVDRKGVILSVNEAFQDLVGTGHLSNLVGSSLSEYLARGQVDLSVMLENVLNSGQIRRYATKMENSLGVRLPVEITAAMIGGEDQPAIGFVMRDIGHAEEIRQPGAQNADSESGQNVIELVGSASLKDIVAETTDVVEKMCIETAISLTNNNRVAAAEMLGLSRQSLYVKLRKFGLLRKGD